MQNLRNIYHTFTIIFILILIIICDLTVLTPLSSPKNDAHSTDLLRRKLFLYTLHILEKMDIGSFSLVYFLLLNTMR